jgi:phosphatidylethanolamine-binding protein (PEBP) family uncharacterized protein
MSFRPASFVILVASSIALSVAVIHSACDAGGGSAVALQLTTTAFSHGGTIPKKHTCDGPDISPALSWNEPPTGTQAFALIMDDSDAPAGTWVHWLLYDLPAGTRALAEPCQRIQSSLEAASKAATIFEKPATAGPVLRRVPRTATSSSCTRLPRRPA